MPGRFPASPVLSAALAATLFSVGVQGQELVRFGMGEGELHLSPIDLAALSAAETRTDLPCRVEPLDPNLEYDLTFQAGYVTHIPLASIAGEGNRLRILFRIQPLDSDLAPVYFRENYEVPRIEEGAQGEAALPGKYRLGPGKYRVEWMMRDRAERLCAHQWEVTADGGPDVLNALAAAPKANTIEEFAEEAFLDEPPVRRAGRPLLNVKILASFSPVDPAKVGLSEYDKRSVVSMLRAIAREPKIGSFSIVAFDAQAEKTLYEAFDEPRIDFPALGEAISEAPSGMVGIDQLQDKKSGERYLRELFAQHMTKAEDEPDAIMFVGPKVTFERNPSGSMVHSTEQTRAPVFSFIYNRNPRSYPWRDALSTALRPFSPSTFDITSPKEFAKSLQAMMEKLTGAAASADSE